jgi:penicillin-binding protein 1A
MQVARNVYLSSEKTYTRKIYEVLLTFKLEHLLSKDQILEIYMNQIFLGNRAYGFAAASEAYFDKPLKDITIAEAAMLAGLPKAPGTNNPIKQPEARARAPAPGDRPHGGERVHHRQQARQRRDESSSSRVAPTRCDCTPNMWRKRCGNWCLRSTATRPTPAD